MRRLFEVDTVIDRPVAEVWRELTAWERASRWMKGVEGMRADPGTQAGATLTYRTRGKTRTSEIEALEPGRSVTLVTRQGGVTARYVYSLAPAGDGTRATLTTELDVAGFPTVLFGPLLRAAIRRTDGGQLDDLRAAIEGSARQV